MAAHVPGSGIGAAVASMLMEPLVAATELVQLEPVEVLTRPPVAVQPLLFRPPGRASLISVAQVALPESALATIQ